MPQKATKCHKIFVAGSSGKKRSFFVKSFGGDRLIVSNGKTGKCHFVAARSNLSFGNDNMTTSFFSIKNINT
jgi:hypothetical protein